MKEHPLSPSPPGLPLPKRLQHHRSIYPWSALALNLVWLLGPWGYRYHFGKDLSARGFHVMVGGGLQFKLDVAVLPGSLHITCIPFFGFALSVWWL